MRRARNALASDSHKVLKTTVRERRNVFEQLIEAVKCNSLGQIYHALNEVGGVSEEYVGMEKNATSVIRWAGSKRKILTVLRDAARQSGDRQRTRLNSRH